MRGSKTELSQVIWFIGYLDDHQNHGYFPSFMFMIFKRLNVFCCLINRVNLCQIYDSYYKILAHEHQVNMADGQRAVLTSVWDLSFNKVSRSWSLESWGLFSSFLLYWPCINIDVNNRRCWLIKTIIQKYFVLKERERLLHTEHENDEGQS